VRILLKEAQEPARGDPLVTARILARDEHGQVERVLIRVRTRARPRNRGDPAVLLTDLLL
jgi:hypothetical protein